MTSILLKGRDNIKKEYDNVVGEVQKLRDEKIEMFELLQQKNTEISSLKETIQLSSQRSTNDGSTTATINDSPGSITISTTDGNHDISNTAIATTPTTTKTDTLPIRRRYCSGHCFKNTRIIPTFTINGTSAGQYKSTMRR